MQLYFVRHGQSANNALWETHGTGAERSSDPELTEVGYRQAEHVGRFLAQPLDEARIVGRDPQNLAGFGITHVYCSLMVRAVETGTAIARRLGLSLQAWHDLHEVGGIYLDGEQPGERNGQPGYNRAYLEQRFPHLGLPGTVSEMGWWNRPFESVENRIPRAQRFVNELFARHGGTDDRVVVVSHGDFYNLMLTVLLALPESEQRWFSLNNTAVSRFIIKGDNVAITYMNRVDFLPRELIT